MTAAVLFDVDGTLIDSNEAHAETWAQALAENGKQIPVRVVRRAIGKGGDKLLAELAGIDASSALGKAIGERRSALFKEALPKLQPFDGARALIQKIQKAGYRLGVATSAEEEEATALLKQAQVEDLLKTHTTADDAEASKPDPDIVEAALKQVRCEAVASFLIGDTPYDVEAGLRAGVRVIAVRSGGWTAEELKGAVAVFDNVAHLARDFDDSPLFR